MTDPAAPGTRRVLVVAHAGRDEARVVARDVAKALIDNGIVVRLLADEADEVGLSVVEGVETCTAETVAAEECELTLVIGGDGTILRASELTHGSGTPLLGLNLGHVGFLAEAESEEVDIVIERIVARQWASEERLTLDVVVLQDGVVVTRTWALNEASVEKAARSRMLEAVVEVDGRPVSRFGCDGVVLATPTGSTAYNFSAGGPVVWPEVEALLMVPISAHALFSRPMVVAPSATLAVEVLDRDGGTGECGVLWCDGRRTVDLRPGARIEVRRGTVPLRLARLQAAPFADRLVAKFGLPVEGWRGAAERRRHRSERRAEERATRAAEHPPEPGGPR